MWGRGTDSSIRPLDTWVVRSVARLSRAPGGTLATDPDLWVSSMKMAGLTMVWGDIPRVAYGPGLLVQGDPLRRTQQSTGHVCTVQGRGPDNASASARWTSTVQTPDGKKEGHRGGNGETIPPESCVSFDTGRVRGRGDFGRLKTGRSLLPWSGLAVSHLALAPAGHGPGSQP